MFHFVVQFRQNMTNGFVKHSFLIVVKCIYSMRSQTKHRWMKYKEAMVYYLHKFLFH